MNETIDEASEGVDIVLYLIDGNDTELTKANEIILERIKAIRAKTILVINKVDTVKKENLLTLIKQYSEAYNFEAIIPISAKKNDGVEEVINKIIHVKVSFDLNRDLIYFNEIHPRLLFG